MSGGIGDYLHYLARLPHFLEFNCRCTDDLTIFVESTVPLQVSSLFSAAFPGLRFAFVPAGIHWTKTNPLLVPDRAVERMHRPAYQYVRDEGFAEITDWFLPCFCGASPVDIRPLHRLVASQPPAAMPYVSVALRDKGFRWWPSKKLCHAIRDMLHPETRILFLGTPNERIDDVEPFCFTPDVAQALAISHGAELFIGTDTGLATMRELTGKKNIYCIDEFWLSELMIRYGYFDVESLRTTKAVFAFGADQLLAAVAKHLTAR